MNVNFFPRSNLQRRFRGPVIAECLLDPIRGDVRVTFGKSDLWCAQIRSKSTPGPLPGSNLTRFSSRVRPWRRGGPPRAKKSRTKGHSGERSLLRVGDLCAALMLSPGAVASHAVIDDSGERRGRLFGRDISSQTCN
eukprot:6585205-Pyramimonas_sp.AAC.1